MAVQLCDQIKSHHFRHFKWVNAIVYKLHFSEDFKKIVSIQVIKKSFRNSGEGFKTLQT